MQCMPMMKVWPRMGGRVWRVGRSTAESEVCDVAKLPRRAQSQFASHLRRVPRALAALQGVVHISPPFASAAWRARAAAHFNGAVEGMAAVVLAARVLRGAAACRPCVRAGPTRSAALFSLPWPIPRTSLPRPAAAGACHFSSSSSAPSGSGGGGGGGGGGPAPAHDERESAPAVYIQPGDSLITIPRGAVSVSFSRSSGAGGQNVNKVSTKAEVRLHLPTAAWVHPDVRARLAALAAGAVNGEGELIVVSQVHRGQEANLQECFDKLRRLLVKAAAIPKVRSMRTGLSELTKGARREDKRHRAGVKARRRGDGREDFE